MKPGAPRKYKFTRKDVVYRWAKADGEWRWPSVMRWLSNLQTPGARCQFLYLFCEWAKRDPPELLALKKDGGLEAEYLLDKFVALDGTPDAPYANSVMWQCMVNVRSFFKKNYRSLEPCAGQMVKRKVKPYRKHKAEQLRQIYNACLTPRDKSLLATCFCTALARETLVELRWLHVEDDWMDQEIPHISIPDTLLKGHGRGKWKGVEQHTFLTPEAKQCLLDYREWMSNTRGVEFARDDHVYLTLHEPYGPMTYGGLGILATRISKRLPFVFSWHDGRRYVQTALEEAGWARTWIQKVKGRKVRGEDNPYSRPEIEKLREAYKHALHCLCFLETEKLTSKVEIDRVKVALGEQTLREQEMEKRIRDLEEAVKLFSDPKVRDALKNVEKKA